jgi:hypothetical protein
VTATSTHPSRCYPITVAQDGPHATGAQRAALISALATVAAESTHDGEQAALVVAALAYGDHVAAAENMPHASTSCPSVNAFRAIAFEKREDKLGTFWTIIANGIDMGSFLGTDEADAVERYARHQGYASAAAMAEVLSKSVAELLAELTITAD